MPAIDILVTFIVTTALFAFIPGPAMMYAAARTLAGGRSAGLMASLGIHLGCYVHVVAAAAGLSMLFHAVPALYLAVKVAGAVYLIWLGVGAFRAAGASSGELPLDLPRKSGRRAFAESIAVEVLNPKTALFFLAFLPQFVDAAAALPVWAQLLILGTVVNLTFSLADIVCVLIAGRLVETLRHSSRARQMAQRLGGTVLVGLGVHVALQRS
ncbi:LysE family translocator [Aquibium sp. ELW1220]|uniref:LysE family translocator n=1 Tax=Aquibium sp. ELW1220 TaxID=2976766 RepID=UPI0025B02965|nr:LysE family translocator [Aquibium sp. ELW1220]MDN2579227.1 LysE family translocator [Aquibium sp. ELW1220]